MSYSFSVNATSQQDAIEKIEAKLAEVVENQPIHSADQEHALAVARAFVGLVEVPEGTEINVSMHGSVSCPGAGQPLTAASVGINVATFRKPLA